MGIEKLFEFPLQIKGEKVKSVGNIVQNDTNSNIFRVRLCDGSQPVDLTGYSSISLTVLKPDGTHCIDGTPSNRITVNDATKGDIGFKLHGNAINIVGECIATVDVYATGSVKMTSGRFAFIVTQDLANNSTAASDSSFPLLQNLINQNNEAIAKENIRVASENDRIANETARKSAETLRDNAEKLRIDGENNRTTVFNQSQQQRNTAFEQAQQQRANSYNAAETDREKRVNDAISGIVSPTVTVKKSTPTEYILDVKDKNGTFSTPNLKGEKGDGTGDMLASIYDPDGDGIVKDANHAEKAEFAFDPGFDYAFPAAATVSARMAANRIRYARFLGATRQPGISDPSPTNIRPIYGVGQFDKKVVLGGTENWVTTGSGTTFRFGTSLPLTDVVGGVGNAFSKYKTNLSISIADVVSGVYVIIYASSGGTAWVDIVNRDFSTLAEFKEWLKANPLTIWYKSTTYSTATQVYIGFSVTDANGYHGYAAGPTAPLYDGDKLTWSGGNTVEVVRVKQTLVFNGTENWIVNDVAAIPGGHRFDYDNYNSPDAKSSTGLVCSHYKSYVGKSNCVWVNNTAGRFGVRIGGLFADLANFKAYLAAQYANNTPVTIVYELATPTTETVAISAPITNASGDVVITAEHLVELVIDGNAPGSHARDKANPHEVTKEQLGLGNVNNTSDNEKPVSIAQREAINTSIPGRNWFDNSDPDATVNQRVADKYEINNAGGNSIYTIDRWQMFCYGFCSYTVSTRTLFSTAEYLKAGWEQRFDFAPKFPCIVSLEINGKIYTQVFTKANPFETKEVFDKGEFGLSLYTLGSVTSFTIYPKPNIPLVRGYLKLETGTIATPYVPKGYGVELSECLRYFFKCNANLNTYATSLANLYRCQFDFPQIMRIVPTIKTTISVDGNNAEVHQVTQECVRFTSSLINANVYTFEASADL